MASIVVNRGLLRTGQQLFESTNYDAARNVQTLTVDDDSNAFAAANDGLDDAGGAAPTNIFETAFDATPTESGQTITCVATIPSGSGNFTVRRIALHDDTTANVTGTSHTLFGGVDGQTLTKTSDFSMEITMKVTFTDNS